MSFNIPQKPFYMIRHGESESNVKGITGGDYDYQLTQKGIKQAQTISLLFKELDLKNILIYASPLSRAYKTAEIINNNTFQILINHGLKERNFGSWDGLEWSKILEKLQNGQEPEDGETTLQHIHRSGRTFVEIINDSIEKNVTPMIVGHGGNFYTLGRLYNQTKIINVDNCELYYFDPILHSKNKLKNLFPWNTWNIKSTNNSPDNNLIKIKQILYSI